MTAIFLKLLNMSISASWLVLAVVLLRLLFKKAPKWIHCVLWAIVALRLVMPFTIESGLSLIPSAEVFPRDIAVSHTPAIHSGIPVVNSTVNPIFTQQPVTEGHVLESVLYWCCVVWMTGMAAMLIYGAVSCLLLRLKLRTSIRREKNVYICDDVDSPFLMGISSPKIYLPSGLEEDQLQYVLAHENAHIKRRDHWWKPLGFLMLTVYWFNPLLWLAYTLLCRDIERACDEKVVSAMDKSEKTGYLTALVACSIHRRMIMVCPVAFGEIGVSKRVKGILSYKKPALWLICVSVAVCAVTAVCFLTNPKSCRHEYRGNVTVASTCTHSGRETFTCELCHHSYAVPVEPHAHEYDRGVVTLEPTCTREGKLLRKCVDCGKQITEILEMTAHIPSGPVQVKEANCTHTGQVNAVCGACQVVFVTEVLPTNDVHSMKETVLQEATCTAEGKGRLACIWCGTYEDVVYPQLEHDYVTSIYKEGTCRSDRWVKIECQTCDYVFVYSAGRASANHSWKHYSTDKKQCEYCGFIVPKEPPLLFPISFDPDEP